MHPIEAFLTNYLYIKVLSHEYSPDPTRRLTVWLEVPQQPLKHFVVGIVTLPFPKVADVPLSADRSRPSLRCIHNGVVQPNRK